MSYYVRVTLSTTSDHDARTALERAITIADVLLKHSLEDLIDKIEILDELED